MTFTVLCDDALLSRSGQHWPIQSWPPYIPLLLLLPGASTSTYVHRLRMVRASIHSHPQRASEIFVASLQGLGQAGPIVSGPHCAAADVAGGLCQQHVHQPSARVRAGAHDGGLGQPLGLLDGALPWRHSCRPHLLTAVQREVSSAVEMSESAGDLPFELAEPQ